MNQSNDKIVEILKCLRDAIENECPDNDNSEAYVPYINTAVHIDTALHEIDLAISGLSQ